MLGEGAWTYPQSRHLDIRVRAMTSHYLDRMSRVGLSVPMLSSLFRSVHIKT